MKLIVLAPMLSTQSALGDVAEVKDAVGFAEIADTSAREAIIGSARQLLIAKQN